jgi:hypothetical protein
MGRHAEAVSSDEIVASLKVSRARVLAETRLTAPGTIREHHLLQLRPDIDQSLDSIPVPSHSHREAYPSILLDLHLVHRRR